MGMRGDDRQPTSMSATSRPKTASRHPLRPIRALVDGILRDVSCDFDGL
jgi:hypothetical protein